MAGKYSEAIPLAQHYRDVAASLTNLATHYEKQGRHADSESLLR